MPAKTETEVEFEKAEKEKADKEKADKEKADKEKADKEKDAAASPEIIKAMREEFAKFEGSITAKLPGMDMLLDGFRDLIDAAEKAPPKSEDEVADLVEEHVPSEFLSMMPGWITLMQPAMEGLFTTDIEPVSDDGSAEGDNDAAEK